MIYIDDHIWDFDLQQALAAVSQQRREHALRYRQERDQRLCIAAYRLLQHALRQECSINELPQFAYNPQGKPLLDGHPNIHFSMSHCCDAVACAVSDQPVGIDIETFEHYSEEVAVRVMSEKEMLEIKSSPYPAMAFTRLWTMKESLYKLTGNDNKGNIAAMLDDISLYHFTTVNHPKDLITICQQGQNP